ncbi:MAG: S8 family serine peptidase [Sedimentisphaerales bacterium]|nr:S8 family serine peptidase [Sedimentisphaerales bacterium]
MANRVAFEQLELSETLDTIHQDVEIREIQPVFRDFKQKHARLEQLVTEDKALLDAQELHQQRRLLRAPQDISVPELDLIYRIKVDLDEDQSLKSIVHQYNLDPDVEYAELNYIVTIDLIPNDPRYTLQWSLDNTGQSGGTPDADIDAPEAWDLHTGTNSVIVAVVDTGVDYTHRDMAGNMWSDTSGYHGYDYVNNDPYPLDDHGHGTHCAGIVAADTGNGLDIAGVSWDAQIMALKVFDENGSGNYDDAADAFYYAVNNGADIITNSWGKDDYSQVMQDAVDYAHSQGVIITAAAGNDVQYYFPHYPSSMDHVLSVASVDSDDEKAGSSNFGDWIDISAPGVDILSLRATGTSMGTPYDNYTTRASGTSMACPHVAGVLALLISYYPGIPNEEIVARLLETADDISLQNPSYEGLLGHGRVNAYQSLRLNFEGVIELDRTTYSCNDTIGLQIRDFEIRGSGLQMATLSTSGGDVETVVLTEDLNNTWVFSGTLSTGMGSPVHYNGILEVSEGQTIIAGYEDQHYGDSGVVTVEDLALVDCVEPEISVVEVNNITSSGVRVQFQTNEASRGTIRYGMDFNNLDLITTEESEAGQKHDLYLGDLNSETIYFFEVDAVDLAGNQATDDNHGSGYPLSTSATPYGLHVPGQYATIQAAVDAALPGETVWVADGIYTGPGNYDIDFLGKAITVRSENGADNCIVDAQNMGRVFLFQNSETSDTVLDGFTITGGWSGSYSYGGAIFCKLAGPIIRNCIVTGNEADNGGGGIGVSNTPTTIIEDCIIKNNKARNAGGVWGGSPEIKRCIISGNIASYDYGGGICLWQDSNAHIEDCVFKNNCCRINNRGGAIGSQTACFLIRNCLFVDNFAMGDYMGGGGIYVNHTNANIENCTFYGNTTTQQGGAMHFRGNRDVYVKNCIVFNNYPQQIYRAMTTGTVTVIFSDVQGGYAGNGNISSEPYFADPAHDDFHVKSQIGRWDPTNQCWVCDNVTSPCIDNGRPVDDWSAELWPHGKRINMGVYAGTAQASMSNSTAGNPADVDLNGSVEFLDLVSFLEDWLTEGIFLSTDFDRDGDIDLDDFGIFAHNWLWLE